MLFYYPESLKGEAKKKTKRLHRHSFPLPSSVGRHPSPGDENEIVEKRKSESGLLNVLALFQLASPMVLWIIDPKYMRISLPFL